MGKTVNARKPSDCSSRAGHSGRSDAMTTASLKRGAHAGEKVSETRGVIEFSRPVISPGKAHQGTHGGRQADKR
jgi:hypothetical protein